MYELLQAGEKTYYIECPTRIGIYLLNSKDIVLIDSGNDKTAAKKIEKILINNNWNLSLIISTHSHADHIGGNKYLQDAYNCNIYSSEIEVPFINHTSLEASFLYGACPFRDLKNKFLYAKESRAEKLTKENLPKGLEIIPLHGHSVGMIGVKTSDDIFFIADSISDEFVLRKYGIPYLYDVENFLSTLEYLESSTAKLFIPAHVEALKDIKPLLKINKEKVEEIINIILDICKEPVMFEELLKKLFDNYNIQMNPTQYVLLGSSIKSYLSYLYEENKLDSYFRENKFLWGLKENTYLL